MGRGERGAGNGLLMRGFPAVRGLRLRFGRGISPLHGTCRVIFPFLSIWPIHDMIILILFLWGGWPGTVLADEALYVRQYRQARPDAETLHKAGQQVREHQNVTLREPTGLAPFHRQLQPLTRGEAFCQSCHAPLPHGKKLRDRTFLNMHSRFIACETCHFRPESVQLQYDWLDYPAWVPVQGDAGRFRTGSQTDNAVSLSGTVKIAPFSQGVPALARRDSDFAREVEQTWQNAAVPERSLLKARLHTPLNRQGPECAACHTGKQPLLDLARLGASPAQVTAIQQHIIPQFFARYRSDEERLRIIDILR